MNLKARALMLGIGAAIVVALLYLPSVFVASSQNGWKSTVPRSGGVGEAAVADLRSASATVQARVDDDHREEASEELLRETARIRDLLALPSRERVVEVQRVLQFMPYADQFRVLDELAIEGDRFASETVTRIARECHYVARYLSEGDASSVGPPPNSMLAAECAGVLETIPVKYLGEVALRFRATEVPKPDISGLGAQDALATIVANELAASEVTTSAEAQPTAAHLLSRRGDIYAAPERYFTNPADFHALGTASAKQRIIRYAEALAQCEQFGLCTSRSTPAYQLCFLPAAQCQPGDSVRAIAARNLSPHEFRLADDLARGMVLNYRTGG